MTQPQKQRLRPLRQLLAIFIALSLIALLTGAAAPSAQAGPKRKDHVWCGIFGPSSQSITCKRGLEAHCYCSAMAGGLWGIAKCECRVPPPPPPPPPPAIDCSIPPRTMSCVNAGLWSVSDPGCASRCAGGYRGVCQPATCIGNRWTQSSCGCVPQ
jgi:hypothetical protein